MTGGKKKIQTRRCGHCQKVGHNKSTCPDYFLASKPVEKSMAGVNFFVHHVTQPAKPSPYLIDLKNQKHDVWKNSEAIAPEESATPLYHFYHKLKSPAPEPTYGPRITKRQLNWPSWSSWQDRIVSWFRLIKLKPALLTALIILIVIGAIILPKQVSSYYLDLKSTTEAIKTNSMAGFLALQDSTAALTSANWAKAQELTAEALDNFDSASRLMQERHHLLQDIVKLLPIMGGELQNRQKLLLAGQEITLGNSYLMEGISASQANPAISFTTRLDIILQYLSLAVPNYQKALNNLKTIDAAVLPTEYQATFKDFVGLFTKVANDFESILALRKTSQEIFGHQGYRRYLLIFQNPAELRPTGGFMGSFAVLDLKDGEIINLDIPAGGTYDLQGQLDEYLEPPAPLLLANKRWEFQDANWFPDFPASAKKILWFYRHSRGVTADGVIAINASVLQRLLSVSGPITDSNRSLTLTADNALTILQNIVEEGPEKDAHKPKQVLADLAPKLIDQLKNLPPSSALTLLTNLNEALKQKEIQAYFTDANAEANVRSFGWGGELASANPNQDYLLVVNTNIQGAKSDAKINQTISHQAVVRDDGAIINTVTISREHTGAAEEKLWGQTNIDYLRVYVPLGSALISAGGFRWPDEKAFRAPEAWYKKDSTLKTIEQEISVDELSGTRVTNEFDKTVFGNWVITSPGETSQAQFTYRLPFKALTESGLDGQNDWSKILSLSKVTSQYQLIVQRQSGANSSLESQIIFPNHWRPLWLDGPGFTPATNGASFKLNSFNTDAVWSLMMEKK